MIIPVIRLLFGGIDFTNLRYIITPVANDMTETTIYYGNFIQNVVNSILMSFVIFFVTKAINHFRKKKKKQNLLQNFPKKQSA